jgi:hypothetical protein
VTTSYPEHEHPQYATKADLEALERRLIRRLDEVELRLTREVNTAFGRGLALILPIYGLLIFGFAGLLLFLAGRP